MPELVNEASKLFPKQKFICLDGYLIGNSMYIPHYTTNSSKAISQDIFRACLYLWHERHKPEKNRHDHRSELSGNGKMIIPGILKGLRAIDPAFQLDIRVLGNWFDAAKAAELSRSLYAQGADIILPICGSASQGAVRVAQETGKYLVFFDDDEFARAPDNILGCTILHQKNSPTAV